jgi:uncharacterized protein YjiS (DUF1127 family)
MSYRFAIPAPAIAANAAGQESLLERIVRRIRRRYQVWRTCQELGALPDEILRDIRVPRCAIRSVAEDLY